MSGAVEVTTSKEPGPKITDVKGVSAVGAGWVKRGSARSHDVGL